MRIKEIHLKRFKRFTNLTIKNIPENTKLILLVGPNGSGKTSLFEALNHWHQFKGFNNIRGNQDYIEKSDGERSDSRTWYQNKVQIQFFEHQDFNQDQIRGKFYFRTAYRNEPDFTISQLSKQNDPTKSVKLTNLMQNDQTVSENYQRLIAQTLAGVYENSNDSKTVGQLREELVASQLFIDG
jgi:chromosome segregation ATPase